MSTPEQDAAEALARELAPFFEQSPRVAPLLQPDDRLSDEDLDAIEKRALLATEGPWRVGKIQGLDCVKSPDEGLVYVAQLGDGDDSFADAAFIASARQDVPALVAELLVIRARDSASNDALAAALRDWLYAIDRWGADSNEAYETQALCRETLRASAREVDG